MIRKTRTCQLAGVAISFALLTACNRSESRTTTTELHSGVIVKNMDTLVKPGDDFTKYVYGAWDKATEIPSSQSSYGAGQIVGGKAIEDVENILEESAEGKVAEGSNEQNIGDFYQSYMDLNTRDTEGITPMAPELKAIDN